jgi:hypothetical protein
LVIRSNKPYSSEIVTAFGFKCLDWRGFWPFYLTIKFIAPSKTFRDEDFPVNATSTSIKPCRMNVLW